jgi:hypothetical protein
MYRVKCKKCGTNIAKGKTIQKLFTRVFQLTARHNLDTIKTELCGDAKNTLSMDDMRGAFAEGSPYIVEEAVEFEEIPVEWDTPEGGA